MSPRRLPPSLVAAFLLLPAAAHAEGMPQLDFGNKLLLSQIVWGALIFAGFYAAVTYWGLPKVGAVLAHREKTIGDDLEQARLAKERADAASAELQEARRRAIAHSQAEIATATTAAKAAAAAKAAELSARLDAQLAESEARIHADRARALAGLETVAVETAQAIISRLTGLSAGPAALTKTVRGVLAERTSAKAG